MEVKGKYQELAPIMKKVHQVSEENKRHENEYKRLLQETEKAQQRYFASCRTLKNLTDQLTRNKQAIDKRLVFWTDIVPIGLFFVKALRRSLLAPI